MQTHVKRINVVAAVVFALPLSALAAPGQQAAPPQAAPAAQPQQAAPGQPHGDSTYNTTDTILQHGFHDKGDQGSIAAGGGHIADAIATRIASLDVFATPALNNAAEGARFKTYLGLPAVPDNQIKAYLDQMNQIGDLLKSGATFPAWKLLYSMSDYTELDAGISRELAHRIEAIWNSDKTQNGLSLANAQLRKDLDTQIHNADATADDLHAEDLEEKAKNGGGGGRSNNNNNSSSTTNSPMYSPNVDGVQAMANLPTMSGALQRKMTLTDEYLQTLESRANIKLNEIRAHKMDLQDQADFASYIKALYDTHRYLQVIVAADFYRQLFNQDEYPVDMATEVNTALEANAHSAQNVQVFKYDAAQGHIAGASAEIQNAFNENEFYPGLKGLDRDQKSHVADYMTKLDVLKNQLETRSFEQVEAQIAEIQKVASDFDPTKPLALVNDVKLSSSLNLGKAKMLAQQGELDDAMKSFQDAAEEWPGNPQLKDSANQFFGTQDVKNKSTDDFDRMITDQNYRGIFDNQIVFATAVHGDPKREAQLKDALTKVQKAEMASEKANLLVMNGDANGAWETIESAVNDWPDDVKLNKQLASLSTRCADFVSAINKARDAESRKEYGYSLTWFVNAASYYPGSTIARAGIDDVSKEILTPSPGPDAPLPGSAGKAPAVQQN